MALKTIGFNDLQNDNQVIFTPMLTPSKDDYYGLNIFACCNDNKDGVEVLLMREDILDLISYLKEVLTKL